MSQSFTSEQLLDTDVTLSFNSDYLAASQKATKTYVDARANATHTGEVTGATTLTVDKTAITNKAVVTADGADYVLISDTSDGGSLKQALVSDMGGGGGGLTHQQIMARISIGF
jgi:hypothetical protein